MVWRFTDGKPGHENQSLGLLNALGLRLAVDAYTLSAASPGRSIMNGLLGSFPAGVSLPDPDIILGAGHATHIHMLNARRARGGRVVVLMKPSMPLKCFDLCVVPEHDGVRPAANVLVTRGALNTMTPDKTSKKQGGLFLIGGPSRHFGWSDEDICSQILAIVDKEPHEKWILSTSRRTPDSFLQAIESLGAKNITIVSLQETGAGWVAEHLAASENVWVTKDSVSMVYEALTSGAAVGLLDLPQRAAGRVARGVAQLIADGLVTTFKTWRVGEGALAPPAREFNEAARCADEICRRWFEVVKT